MPDKCPRGWGEVVGLVIEIAITKRIVGSQNEIGVFCFSQHNTIRHPVMVDHHDMWCTVKF